MNTTNETIEKLITELDLKKGTELFGANGLVKQITKRLVEKALEAEMTEHLGYEKASAATPRARTPGTGPPPSG
jgi:putative transposase